MRRRESQPDMRPASDMHARASSRHTHSASWHGAGSQRLGRSKSEAYEAQSTPGHGLCSCRAWRQAARMSALLEDVAPKCMHLNTRSSRVPIYTPFLLPWKTSANVVCITVYLAWAHVPTSTMTLSCIQTQTHCTWTSCGNDSEPRRWALRARTRGPDWELLMAAARGWWRPDWR